MELSSKQRAQLRGLANSIDTILIVGKDGIGDNLVKQANDVASCLRRSCDFRLRVLHFDGHPNPASHH